MFFAAINGHTQIWTSEQDKDTNDPFLIIAVKGKKSSSNSFNGVKQKQLMKTFQTFCLVHHREKDRYSYFLLVFGCNFNGIQCKIWIMAIFYTYSIYKNIFSDMQDGEQEVMLSCRKWRSCRRRISK